MMEKILRYSVLVLMPFSLYLAFLYAPVEKTMGIVQKIFYFHVPGAWVASLAFLIVFIASILFLKTTDFKYDIIARASAEIGVVFCTLTLLTGPIWGKFAWGAWWDWGEPKLVIFLVLWLMYLGYLLLHRSIQEDLRRAKYAAVYGIAAFLDVPIVFLSVLWYRTVHPPLVIVERGGLDAKMKLAFFVSLFTFTLLYFIFFQQVRSTIELRERLKEIKSKLEG
jgi:heme exporter protein C